MNLLQRRREMMMGQDKYKDYIKIWLTTTADNNSQNIIHQNNTSRLEDVVLDGVSLGSVSPVIIPEKGDHTLYIKITNNKLSYNDLYWRSYKVVEIPASIESMAENSIVVIVHPWTLRFLSPTPPLFTGKIWGVNSRKPDIVQVPKGSMELYKANQYFSDVNFEEI